MRVSFGYAYLAGVITRSATPDEVGGRISDLARHSGNLHARYTVPGTPIDLRFGGNYRGPRAVASASPVLLPDVVLVELGMGGNLGLVRADVTVNNLLDRRYFTVAGVHQGNNDAVYPGDPRTVALRLGVTF